MLLWIITQEDDTLDKAADIVRDWKQTLPMSMWCDDADDEMRIDDVASDDYHSIDIINHRRLLRLFLYISIFPYSTSVKFVFSVIWH